MSRFALVVIDLIQDYFEQEIWPGSRLPSQKPRLVRATNELVAIARQSGVPVLWFRQEFKPDLSDAFLHVKSGGKRYAIAGTSGSLLLPELSIDDEDLVLTKTRYSAFFETDLERTLEERGVDSLILAGITTAWCIRSTATDAYQRDYRILFAEDCLAAFTEDAHRRAVEDMEPLLGPFLSNTEIAEKLRTENCETLRR